MVGRIHLPTTQPCRAGTDPEVGPPRYLYPIFYLVITGTAPSRPQPRRAIPLVVVYCWGGGGEPFYDIHMLAQEDTAES